ncbi:MAG: GNAT family N-acetyltransferase [Christensenellaceae bacterium]|nr:GNAT family N-acetyltransferase [Christensenellaceae bacterium]
MRYFEKIAGERIYLSPINEEDLPLYTRWMNDPETTESLGMKRSVFSLAQEKEALQSMARSETEKHFAIVLREGNRLIGGISLQNLQPFNRRAEVGIFIGEEEDRGKGYGMEAMRLLLGFAFLTLGLHSVSLSVFAFNARAIAAYKKVGFKKCGQRREAHFADGAFHDILTMDILAHEFLAENPAKSDRLQI